MSFRIEKINKLIKQQVAAVFSRELNLKQEVFVTVSKVDTSPDLRYTRVFVSIFPEKETSYCMKTLEKERVQIQKNLHQKMHAKNLPKIEFMYDKTMSNADEIEKLLKKIGDEKNDK